MSCLKPPFQNLLAALLLWGCASQPGKNSYPDLSALARNPDMPDPLVLQDGKRITSPKQWVNQRRLELESLFQHYMYGNIPHLVTRATVLGQYPDFLDGKATLKLVSLEVGPANA